MRAGRFASAALLLAALPGPSASADGPRPLVEDLEPGRVARVVVFVPPEYPAPAVQGAVEAVVDVFGRIQADGSFRVDRIESKPEREDFRKEVRDVARYWIFRPRYDRECRVHDEEKQLRVWFEMKEGKPSISVSGMTREKPPEPKSDPRYEVKFRVEPKYPYTALREGRQGTVEALVRIAHGGEVEEVIIVPGRDSAVFGEAVRTALARWEFIPAERPIRCASYEVVFRIRGFR